MAEQEELKFYTVIEVAKLLKCDKVTVRRKINDGKLKAFKTDGNKGDYRIRHSALEAYIKDQELLSQSE